MECMSINREVLGEKGGELFVKVGESWEEEGESRDQLASNGRRTRPLRLVVTGDLLSSCHNPNHPRPRQLFWPHHLTFRALHGLGSRPKRFVQACHFWASILWLMDEAKVCGISCASTFVHVELYMPA